MSQLEKVYLLNVLIYINEIHSLRKFLFINHKTQEVSLMLRISTEKKCYDATQYWYYIHQNPYIPNNLYELFPTIETIECKYEELLDKSKEQIFEKVKKIRITIGSIKASIPRFDYQSIKNTIMNKIEYIKFEDKRNINSFDFISTNFPNLKKFVIINTIEINKLLKNDFNLELDEIIFKYCPEVLKMHYKTIIEELKSLKKYKMIKKKCVMILEADTPVVKELESIFDVVCCPNIRTIDGSEYYFEKDKSIDLNEIVTHVSETFFLEKPQNFDFIHHFDLRKCISLERISLNTYLLNLIKIEGLKNLQEIEFVKNMNQYDVCEIPSTVTTLVCSNFTTEQNIDRIVWNHSNIKTVEIIENENFNNLIIHKMFPNKDIQLDELHFKMNSFSTNGQIINLSAFFELQRYPNIKNKTLDISCKKYLPKYEEVEALRRIMNVNVDIECFINSSKGIENININIIPKQIKHIILTTSFDWRFIKDPQILSQIECIYYPLRQISLNGIILDLQCFNNCKEMIISLPCGNVIFPNNLENIEIVCRGQSFSCDLSYLTKLKTIVLRNPKNNQHYHFILPNVEQLFKYGTNIYTFHKHSITNYNSM